VNKFPKFKMWSSPSAELEWSIIEFRGDMNTMSCTWQGELQVQGVVVTHATFRFSLITNPTIEIHNQLSKCK